MCGEIQPWQIAKLVNVRLTTSGALQTVTLNKALERVEEIWLDEIQVTGFNAGVSAGAYFNLTVNGMHSGACSNEGKPGVLVMIDILNPHTVYQRPKSLAVGSQCSVNTFKLSVSLPNGTPVTFTEACLSLTFVCRRSPEELEEVRKLKASVDYPPSIRDGAVRNDFNPNEYKSRNLF